MRAMLWFVSGLAHPVNATAVLIVSLSIGIGLALVQAQETRTKQWKTLETRYAMSVDPLAMPR
jgi:hypothetical protein